MFQIIDVSSRILYDKQKAENKLVGVINASLSHEMRNPLNSIIAQNIEKARLYTELEKILEENPSIKERTSAIMKQLIKGKKVQESSCKIMMYLVSDFLDYAQIIAGKFRKNVTTFNI